jgi:hypothetical protein
MFSAPHRSVVKPSRYVIEAYYTTWTLQKNSRWIKINVKRHILFALLDSHTKYKLCVSAYVIHFACVLLFIYLICFKDFWSSLYIICVLRKKNFFSADYVVIDPKLLQQKSKKIFFQPSLALFQPCRASAWEKLLEYRKPDYDDNLYWKILQNFIYPFLFFSFRLDKFNDHFTKGHKYLLSLFPYI